MKVTHHKTMIVENDPPYRGGRYLLFLELHTDGGIVGLGERITGNVFSDRLQDLQSFVAIINEYVNHFVVGRDPFKIELIWQTMYASRHDFRHPSLHAGPVLSAIEMALWDIVGKAVDQPIYNLLGGQYHDKLRAYAYMPEGGFREHPEKAGEIAAQLLEAGNSACKLDPFHPLFPTPRDIPLHEIENAAKIFKSIRDAVGNAMEVGIGTHGQLTTYSAIRTADMLEEYHPFWFEEPVPPENVDEMARVAAHTSIPIATGERLVTKYEFANVLEKQAAQIIQLDVGQCGGIMEAKKGGRDSGSTLRSDRAAHGVRSHSGGRGDTARHMLSQLHDPRGEPGPTAPHHFQGAASLRKRLHHPADRSRPGGGARRRSVGGTDR